MAAKSRVLTPFDHFFVNPFHRIPLKISSENSLKPMSVSSGHDMNTFHPHMKSRSLVFSFSLARVV